MPVQQRITFRKFRNVVGMDCWLLLVNHRLPFKSKLKRIYIWERRGNYLLVYMGDDIVDGRLKAFEYSTLVQAKVALAEYFGERNPEIGSTEVCEFDGTLRCCNCGKFVSISSRLSVFMNEEGNWQHHRRVTGECIILKR